MSKVVKLNVGGKRFETTEMTLKRFEDSMLALMIRQPNELEKINQGQELFIDRDGEYFSYVLNYLRNGDQMTTPQENTIRGRLIDEANFYLLPGLADLIKEAGALKVGDIVQLQDSAAARAYLDSVIIKEKGYYSGDSKYKCWICFGLFQMPQCSIAKEHSKCHNKEIPIKYDILVGKIAAIDGQCAKVTVTKSGLLAVFSSFLWGTDDEELSIHIPLAFLKLLNQ